MIDLLSTVRFAPSYPQLIIPTSQTKFGGRVLSTVEYADRYRTVDMETLPMKASEAVQLQAFIAAAQGGMETIVYRPKHICIPRAYWGQPSGPNTNPGDVAALGDFRIGSYNVRGETVPQSTAMSFARNSIATYFDSAGVMRTAAANEPRFDHDPSEVNYAWPSEDLTNSRWNKLRMSATLANVRGGYRFTRMVPDTTPQVTHRFMQTLSFAPVAYDRTATQGFIVKSDGLSTTRLSFRLSDTTGFIAYRHFDVLNGVSTGGDAGIPFAVTDMGEGYFRIDVTQPVRAGSTVASVEIYSLNPNSNSTSDYDFNGIDGYLVSALQFTWGSTVLPYLKTTNGPVAKALGLMVEPTRTNNLTFSMNIGGGTWNSLAVTTTVNASVAPDGTTTASLLEFTGNGTASRVFRGVIVPAVGEIRTKSCWLWADTAGKTVRLLSYDNGTYVVGPLITLTTIPTRYFYTAPAHTSATASFFGIANGSSSPQTGIYAWGGQDETGIFATSFIPTANTAVIRQADVATLFSTGTNSWSVRNETGATQSLGNISGGAQLTSANLNSKYVRDYKAVTVTAPPSPIEATATRGTVTNGYTVQLLNVTPGLELRDGDLISFQSGDYRQMVQIAYGGVPRQSALR